MKKPSDDHQAPSGIAAPESSHRLDAERKDQLLESIVELLPDAAQKRVEQALRENETKYRTLFETASDAIFLMRDDRFVDCNQRTLTMFGCSREQIIGAPPHRFSPPVQPDGRSSKEKALAKINLALSNGPQRFEWQHCRADRTPFSAEVSLNRIELAGETMLQAIVRDVSARKRAEEALERYREHLEEQVEERTRELAAAKDRAESADRLKSAFLATMSHELRTPLNSVIGFTGILLQQIPGELNAEQKKQLGMVQKSARHLLSLINDVLDISKIEAGQISLESEPFDVRDSAEAVVSSVHQLARDKGLSLVSDLAPELGEIIGDRRRYEQVLLNLLSNAIKFTNAGSISLTVRAVEAGVVESAVRDTGIGIRLEDREAIFRPFYQVENGTDRTQEGTGLGLSVSRRLIEMMGGEIWVASAAGEGSTFGFTVPRRTTGGGDG